MLWPSPYPGELVSSNLIRGCRWNGVRFTTLCGVLSSGKRTADGWLFSGNLPALSALADLPPRVLLADHTPYAYVAASQYPEARQRLAIALVKQLALRKFILIGSLAGIYRNVPWRRFCPQCRQLELSKLGESYWHVEHHLPGVLLCPHHRVTLSQTPVPTVGAGGAQVLTLPDDFPVSLVETYGLDHALLMAIAQESMDFLNGAVIDAQSYVHYRLSAIRLGYLLARHEKLSSRALAIRALEMFGEPFLASLKCSIRGEYPWVATMLRYQVHPIFSSVRHVLMRVFLRLLPEANGSVLMVKPGTKSVNKAILDQELSARLSTVLSELSRTNERISLTEFLRRAGRSGSIHHIRNQLPLVEAVLSKFKSSPYCLGQCQQPRVRITQVGS